MTVSYLYTLGVAIGRIMVQCGAPTEKCLRDHYIFLIKRMFEIPKGLNIPNICLTTLVWIPTVHAIRMFHNKAWHTTLLDVEKIS